jgi:predicted ABC-type ATPase
VGAKEVSPDSPTIFVLAGANGAGRSSVGGAAFRTTGREFFNPDEIAREIRELGYSVEDASSQAWQLGAEQLRSAIRNRADFSFETTLGANTIPRLLREAAKSGFDVGSGV